MFNALTRSRKAEAENFPFCTIEPNRGIAVVEDARLQALARMVGVGQIVPATLELVDIAGLVAGASAGEGLGNQFLAHIREVDALIHLVRCFQDPDVVHHMGTVDPVRDIEVVNTELLLADLQSCQAQLERQVKRAKSLDRDALATVDLLNRLLPHLNAGKPALSFEVPEEDRARMKSLCLLSTKPVLFVCNLSESALADPLADPAVSAVAAYARQHQGSGFGVVCSKLEQDLADLSPEETASFLEAYGLSEMGVSQIVRSAYSLLHLGSFLTFNQKEVRAWTFRSGMKAPECAGLIHTDFERGFIKAEVVSWSDLAQAGSFSAARESGRYRIEGRDYLMRDGDVVLFRFSP